MKSLVCVSLALCSVWTTCSASVEPLSRSTEPFDYFQNSWNVIGLKDYNDGTRVTPANELLLANKTKLRISYGANLTPLSRKQTKTLLEGWMPIVLLSAEDGGIRYQFTFWAAPMPVVQDWKSAYNWPVAGENYLNWIRVTALNTGTTQAEAKINLDWVGTNSTGNIGKWSTSLAPGASGQMTFAEQFVRNTNLTYSVKDKDGRLWLERTAQFWRDLLAQGAQITVPCDKANQAWKASHVCQFIANDHGVLHGGEGFYDEFYIRDGGYQILELEEAGFNDAARKAVDAYLQVQRPDGRFETQTKQFDANGQALWVLWQYGKITGDRVWLMKAYPQMRRSVEWIKKARREAPTNSPFAGLLPAAPADGEFLWDGKHHIPGYDFWNLRGLICTADAARELREGIDVLELEDEIASYRRAIHAAWQRTGLPYYPPSWEKAGTHWGNTETLWPTELFFPDDPGVGALLKEVRERHGGGFLEGTIRWTGQPDVIHPYLSSYTTMASLVRGEHEKFAEEFYWYLLHTSASHAFPEGIYFKRRYAWSETIPHATGAANFSFLLRHALLHERGNELHLLLGAPDWWLDPGKEITVENAPTHFGRISLKVRGEEKGVLVDFTKPNRQTANIVLHLPNSRRLLNPYKTMRVAYRENQNRRWDMPTVLELYQKQAAP